MFVADGSTDGAAAVDGAVGGADGDGVTLLKSEISQVHEIALKRNLSVSFDVVRESGPPHLKNFLTQCTCGNIVVEGKVASSYLELHVVVVKSTLTHHHVKTISSSTVFVIYCASKLHVLKRSFDAQLMTSTVSRNWQVSVLKSRLPGP